MLEYCFDCNEYFESHICPDCIYSHNTTVIFKEGDKVRFVECLLEEHVNRVSNCDCYDKFGGKEGIIKSIKQRKQGQIFPRSLQIFGEYEIWVDFGFVSSIFGIGEIHLEEQFDGSDIEQTFDDVIGEI